MMLGWVQAGWLKRSTSNRWERRSTKRSPLAPIETGAPSAGRKAGLEVRLLNGWNYYLEYRNGQGVQIADRNLPTNDRVLGTDVVSAPYAPPISRPTILLLNNDIDGDGAVLGNGQDYEETDTTDPVYPTDFKIDVSGVNGSKADVRVRYGVNSRPDPPSVPGRPGPTGSGRARTSKSATRRTRPT